MKKIYAYKPSNSMPHIGRYYYPDGLPKDNEPDILFQMTEYIDINDKESFWICETQQSINEQIQKWGFIVPFFPLFGTPPPDSI